MRVVILFLMAAAAALPTWAQATRSGMLPSDVINESYLDAMNCVADSVAGKPADADPSALASQLVTECNEQFFRATERLMLDGWSAGAANKGESIARQAAIGAMTPLLSKRRDERAALLEYGKAVYLRTRNCATKVAIDYKELREGDQRMFFDFINGECNNDAETAAVVRKLPDLDAEKFGKTAALAKVCGITLALENLKYSTSMKDICIIYAATFDDAN